MGCPSYVKVQIPAHAGTGFRSMAGHRSDRCRSTIPEHACLFSRRFDPPFRFALTRAEVEKAAENQAPTIIGTGQCCVKKWVNPMRKLTGSIRRARITNFRFAILARTYRPKPHRPTPILHFAVALKRRVESDLVD